jgi:large subunit ribosomal protein L54
LVRNQIRSYSSDNNASVAAPPSPPAPRQPTVGNLSTPSAISSATPGVSQPLSTPEGVHVDVNPAESTKPTAVRAPSSCPAGTKMNGLNYFKNKPDVFAKEDSEYPEWLWNLLGDSSKDSKTKKGGVDPSSKFHSGIMVRVTDS